MFLQMCVEDLDYLETSSSIKHVVLFLCLVKIKSQIHHLLKHWSVRNVDIQYYMQRNQKILFLTNSFCPMCAEECYFNLRLCWFSSSICCFVMSFAIKAYHIVNIYQYHLYGNLISSTEAVSNPWQVASGYLDAATGLYKFGRRYYSPTLGRWTQQDPVGGNIGKVGSGNAYVCADNALVENKTRKISL